MTTATLSTEPSEKRHYFMTFNQDGSSLAVAGKYGYRLYPLERMNSTDEAYKSSRSDVCIVERLFTSSLVAIVSLNSPRKMKVCHFRKGTEICNYSYSNTILSIKLNRKCLVVCLDESLYIHMLSDMNIAHTIRDTPPNPTGLLALSPDMTNCYLAYPGSATVGEVQIFDAKNLTAKVIIHAHDSPLAALAFSQNGLQIATASEKGTVIRVFSSIDGRKLYEFRRGVKRCVSISGLAFSPCGQFLACSSNTETVHVFKLEEPRESPTEEANSTWMGYFSSYLPTQVTDVLTQGRAFSTAYLPESGVKNTLAFGRVDKEIKLYVATELGSLYVYNFNKSEGGEMQLEKRLDLNEGAVAAAAPGGPASLVDGEPTEGGDWTEPIDAGLLGSYAGIVKGNPPGKMSESDKMREMEIACASPPKDVLHLKDDQSFPPLSPNSEAND